MSDGTQGLSLSTSRLPALLASDAFVGRVNAVVVLVAVFHGVFCVVNFFGSS